VDAIFIGKMSVDAEGHIPQIFQERFVCSDGKLVEDCSQFVIRSAIQVHADRVSRFWCLRGMHPVSGGKRDCLMLQVGIRHFVFWSDRIWSFMGLAVAFVTVSLPH